MIVLDFLYTKTYKACIIYIFSLYNSNIRQESSYFRFIGGHLGFWALALKGPYQNDVTWLFFEVFMFNIPIDIKYSKKNFNTSNIYA